MLRVLALRLFCNRLFSISACLASLSKSLPYSLSCSLSSLGVSQLASSSSLPCSPAWCTGKRCLGVSNFPRVTLQPGVSGRVEDWERAREELRGAAANAMCFVAAA